MLFSRRAPLGLTALLPQSLLGRSLLILTAPIVLIQVVTMAVFMDRHWDEVTGRLAEGVSGEIAWVADAVEDGATPAYLFARARRDFDFTCTLRTKGTIGGALPDPPRWFWEAAVHKKVQSALQAALPDRKALVSVDLKTKTLEVWVALRTGGVLYVTAPTRRVFSPSAYIFLIWAAGSALTLGLVAVLFMRGQVRPIRRLAVAAERLGRGQPVPPFTSSGATEVRQATAAFFDMQRRIRRHVEQRTAMLAGVSHDLGTVLTRLKLGLAVLPESADAMALKADVAEMERMLGAYLDFARGAGEEAFVRTDVGTLLRDLAARAGVPVDVRVEGEVSARVRPVAMGRAISNLLANAARHGGRIWASVLRDGGHVEVRVEDDGPGVPEDQREEAFTPFTRLAPGRSLAEGAGVGLGLAIVRDVAHAHGGKVWLEASRAHGGVCAVLRLPV
ncbi:MAG TPA: two-component sensor histidine kinase [Rhodospirillaceae bacterium]|jgi:two-component system osmolarity sensor histidine kinase EnvZ|nr:HAMP domain-containing protein [Alphaproteobacteria bacterium]HBH26639.1 two-component sensor histidine kinase [Rhodospirillaceae bacterium]